MSSQLYDYLREAVREAETRRGDVGKREGDKDKARRGDVTVRKGDLDGDKRNVAAAAETKREASVGGQATPVSEAAAQQSQATPGAGLAATGTSPPNVNASLQQCTGAATAQLPSPLGSAPAPDSDVAAAAAEAAEVSELREHIAALVAAEQEASGNLEGLDFGDGAGAEELRQRIAELVVRRSLQRDSQACALRAQVGAHDTS